MKPSSAPYIIVGLLVALCAPIVSAAILSSDGSPDAGHPDLRLWLRADAGIKDTAGRSPTDPDFRGNVGTWSDQSSRHFDLTAKAEHAPFYIAHQSGAGMRPTIAMGGDRYLGRLNDNLHEHPQATMILVMQLLPGGDAGGNVYSVGDMNRRHETLSLMRSQEGDSSQLFLRWYCPGSHDDIYIDDNVRIPGDRRFVIVTVRSAGENSDMEVQDACGDALGVERELLGRGRTPASNQCSPGFVVGGSLGGGYSPALQYGYDGQIAELMVYNRALSLDEGRVVAGYLRRKYRLDTLDALMPDDTYLMQAEDFDGPWDLRARWYPWVKASQGNRHVIASGKPAADGIKRSVSIARAGAYSVWVRALQGGKDTALQATVRGKTLPITHDEGSQGMIWQLAGTVDLPKGDSEVVVRGPGYGQKTCDAVLLSANAKTLSDVESICAMATCLRQAPSPGQLMALFDDGRRLEGNFVAGWRGSGATITQEASPRPAMRSLTIAGLATQKDPSADALIEFQGGDHIAATIVGCAPAQTVGGKSTPALLQVRPAHEIGQTVAEPITIDSAWLRRITFSAENGNGMHSSHAERAIVTCRDGRSFAFKRLHWTSDGISLLTAAGIVRLTFQELSRVQMEPLDPWEAYYRQLAVLAPDPHEKIVRIETSNMVVTASPSRITTSPKNGEQNAPLGCIWPVWSFAPIPVNWAAVARQWQAAANIVPLSLFAPEQVMQNGPLGASFAWQPDRSASGSELLAGGQRYLWGFGVHASNALAFKLPDAALSFQSNVGIDDCVGRYGCAVAKVCLNDIHAVPAFQSRPLLGLQASASTGNIALTVGGQTARWLILSAEPAADPHSISPSGLDIGDHVDWLEPTLVLESTKLRVSVTKLK